jgi:hypothetical protein
VVVAAGHHGAHQADAEQFGDAQVVAQVVGLQAAGADLQGDAGVLGNRAQVAQGVGAQGGQRRVVADLEQRQAGLRGPLDHVGEGERVLHPVGAAPEEGVGAQSDRHATLLLIEMWRQPTQASADWSTGCTVWTPRRQRTEQHE